MPAGGSLKATSSEYVTRRCKQAVRSGGRCHTETRRHSSLSARPASLRRRLRCGASTACLRSYAGLPPRLVSSSEGSGQCRLLGGHQSQRRADRTQPGGTQRVVPVQAKLALVPGRRTQCHVGTVSWQDPSLGGPRPPRVQLTELAARAPHPHGGGPHPMMLARERVKRATSSSGLKV
jgi:hypothetical protein